jgi:flagellar biosynthetic protein FliR
MDLLSGRILGFVLVLTRVSTFLGTMPIFSWPSIPQVVKVSLAILLTVFFATIVPVVPGQVSTMGAMLAIVNEAIYGFALGLAATLLFSVIRVAGTIIEQEMGLNMSEVFDPITGEPAQAVSTFLEMVFILLLLSANVHHVLLSVLSHSYEAFPIGSSPDIAVLAGGVISAGTQMLTLALQFAAPVLAASMVLMVILAIASRLIPEMDIFFFSLPLKIGLGLLMLAILLPYVDSYVWEFAMLVRKLLPA